MSRATSGTSALAAWVVVAVACGAAWGAYPLKASASGRYLVDATGAPFMIVGDSPQALIVNITEAEADSYFADRQAHGFNTVWVNLLCTTYTGGRPDGSTIDGILPFTGTLPGGGTYDLGTPNEAYFAHVDRILERAAAHGIQVLLDPIETGGWLTTMLDNGETRCRDYGRYLGQRYAGFDNILWMSGNDFQGWQDPTNDAVVLAVAQGIRDNDTRHLQTVELNFLESSSLDDEAWRPLLGLNATYTYSPTYARLLQDYARADFLPNFLVEANYEFESAQGPTTDAPILRKQEYWSMTSGATGQMYGNHYTWPFLDGWQEHLDTPGANEMSHLVALFAPRAWYDLVPDTAHAVLTVGYGTYASSGYVADNDYATAARTPDGSLVIVYTPVVRALTLDMTQLSGGAVTRWYDPSDGSYVPIAGSPFPNTGSRSFTPPGPNADGDGGWVLVVEAGTVDSEPPSVTLTAPSADAVLSGAATLSATAADHAGVAGVQFRVDGEHVGAEIARPPYTTTWSTPGAANGPHVVSATARDLAGNVSTDSVAVTVDNTSPLPPADHLAAAYAFDEAGGTTTEDASGHGNQGTLHGATFTGGKNGNALAFDGWVDYAEVPNSPSLDIAGTGLTLAFWVLVNSTTRGTDYVIVGKPWSPTMMISPYYQYGVEYANVVKKALDLYFGDTEGAQRGPYAMTPVPGVWTHVAYTYDGSTVKGYLNGVEALSTATSGSIQARGNSLRLGVDAAYQQHFDGLLDDLRIYDRALTQSEIQEAMHAAVASVAGAVPDGWIVPGPPLRVSKAPGGNLHLAWGESCSASATGYAIYQGTLPIAGSYDHVPLGCNLGNVTAANVTPAPGSTYYLVVAETTSSEGSYGHAVVAGAAQEIPQGAGACRPQRLTSCP